MIERNNLQVRVIPLSEDGHRCDMADLSPTERLGADDAALHAQRRRGHVTAPISLRDALYTDSDARKYGRVARSVA